MMYPATEGDGRGGAGGGGRGRPPSCSRAAQRARERATTPRPARAPCASCARRAPRRLSGGDRALPVPTTAPHRHGHGRRRAPRGPLEQGATAGALVPARAPLATPAAPARRVAGARVPGCGRGGGGDGRARRAAAPRARRRAPARRRARASPPPRRRAGARRTVETSSRSHCDPRPRRRTTYPRPRRASATSLHLTLCTRPVLSSVVV